jgi:hypothetical protein
MGLSFSPATLAKMCAQNKGPKRGIPGRVALHTPQALDAFAKGRIQTVPAGPGIAMTTLPSLFGGRTVPGRSNPKRKTVSRAAGRHSDPSGYPDTQKQDGRPWRN